MKTTTLTPQRKALVLARHRRQIQATYYNYVAIRQAYCQGMVTLQELAHALALIQNEVES
jgi:hypothetical protein